MIVDTHAHLTYEGVLEDIDGVLARARAAGVGKIITVGTDPIDSRAAVKVAESHENVWATVGVHPHDAAGVTPGILRELAELAQHPKVVAWGETGLDYFRDHSPREVQRRWFKEQARLAGELTLPLVVHDRDAHEDVLQILERDAPKGLRGVMHCFSGDVELARRVLKLGFFISIPGTVTYPANQTLREVVKFAPLERLVVETDCPFLTPVPFRGKKNEPALIVHTVAEVAKIKGLVPEDVARITTRAAGELFAIGEADKDAGGELVYAIRRSLYLNVTDRCSNACAFCPKGRSKVVKGHDLTLSHEPTPAELLAGVEQNGGVAPWDEVVFCGFGEPLLRPDVVVATARELKARGAKKVRVNTDGLANLVHGRNVAAELAGVVDAVSVSLNAPDAAAYEKLCRPSVDRAFAGVLEFLKAARAVGLDVTATAVTVPGLDVAACEALALSLGVKFRAREYNEVG